MSRPSAAQLNNFLNTPRPSTGAIGGATGNRRPGGAASDFLQGNRPSQLPASGIASRPGTGRPGTGRPGTGRPGVAGGAGERLQNARAQLPAGGQRPDRIENRGERQQNRQDRRDQVRDQIEDNHPRLDFWLDHPNWAQWRLNAPYRWATWAALGSWVGYGWSDEGAYDYGESVYYDEGQVYSEGQPIATEEEYTEQAEAIATAAPEADPAASEWMPLGVFALTQDGQASGASPSIFMQLALSKQGVISGTLSNTLTGQVKTLEGTVDKESQRAAWCVEGTERPIMETGIANLTKDTAPVLIHFADGQTQQWLLVHLDEPKTSPQATPSAKATP